MATCSLRGRHGPCTSGKMPVTTALHLLLVRNRREPGGPAPAPSLEVLPSVGVMATPSMAVAGPPLRPPSTGPLLRLGRNCYFFL